MATEVSGWNPAAGVTILFIEEVAGKPVVSGGSLGTEFAWKGTRYVTTEYGALPGTDPRASQAFHAAASRHIARAEAPRTAEQEAAITGVERVKTGTGLAVGEERVIDSVVYRGTAEGKAIPVRRTDVIPSARLVPGGPHGLELAPGAFFKTAAGEVYGYEGLVKPVAAAKKAEPVDAYAETVWTPEYGFQSSRVRPQGVSTREFTPRAGSADWFKGLFYPLAWTREQERTKAFAAGLKADVSEFQQRSELIKSRAAAESAVFEAQEARYRTDVTGFKEKYAPFLVSVDGRETYLFSGESDLLPQAKAEQAVLEYRGQALQTRAIALRTAYEPVFAGLRVESKELQARADYLNVSNQAVADLVAGTNIAIAAKNAQALGAPLLREDLPRTRTVTVWTDEGVQYFEVDAPEVAKEKYRLSHPVSSRFIPAPSLEEGALVSGARTAWAWSPPGILEAVGVGAGAVFGGAARTAYGVATGEVPLGQAVAAETPELKASREYFGAQAALLGLVTAFQVAGPTIAAFAPNIARGGTVLLGKVSQRLPAPSFTMPAIGAGAVHGVVSIPTLAVSPPKYVAGVAGAALGGASWGALSAIKYGEVASGKQARVISKEGMPQVQEAATWKGVYYEGKTRATPLIGFMGRKPAIGAPQRVVLGGTFPLGKQTVSTIEARFFERAVLPSGKPLTVQTGEALAASRFLSTTRKYAEAVRFAEPRAGYPGKLKVALDASRATAAENLVLQRVTTGEIRRSAQAIPRITRTRSQFYGSGTIKQWMTKPPTELKIHDIDIQNVFGAENLAQRYVRELTSTTVGLRTLGSLRPTLVGARKYLKGISTSRVEVGGVLSKSGRVLVQATGKRFTVTVPAVKKGAAASFHTHPPYSFSLKDSIDYAGLRGGRPLSIFLRSKISTWITRHEFPVPSRPDAVRAGISGRPEIIVGGKGITVLKVDKTGLVAGSGLRWSDLEKLSKLPSTTPKTWYGTAPGTFQVIKRVAGETTKLVDIHPIGGADVYQPRQASLGFETQLPVALKADKALVMAAGESAARKGVLSAVAIRPGGVVGPMPERLKDLAWRAPIFESLKFDAKQYASARKLLTELERLYPAEALEAGAGVAASRAAVVSPSILVPASAVAASIRVSEPSGLPSLPSLPSVSMALSPSLVSPSFVSPFVGPSPSLSPYFSPSFYSMFSLPVSPSFSPSVSPSFSPYVSPSVSPSVSPYFSPYISPSVSPSFSPSVSPSFSPSGLPGFVPEYFLLGGLEPPGGGGLMPRDLFKGVKQLTRYMPDLTSFVYGIRGRMPDIELFTGAELRPLLW